MVELGDLRMEHGYITIITLLFAVAGFQAYVLHVDYPSGKRCMFQDNSSCPFTVNNYPDVLNKYNWECVERNSSVSFCLVNNKEDPAPFITFYRFNDSYGDIGVFPKNKSGKEFLQGLETKNMTDVWMKYWKIVENTETTGKNA